MAVYPASNNSEAIELNISNANQFFTILRGGVADSIPTFEGFGEVPSVAKALAEAAAYKTPLAWQTSGTENDLLQPRVFNNDLYVPLQVPANFTTTPDPTEWRLLQPLNKVKQIVGTFNTDQITSNVLDFGSSFQYAPNTGNLVVFVGGVYQIVGEDITESGLQEITFLYTPPANTTITIIIGQLVTEELDLVAFTEAAEDSAIAAAESEANAQIFRDEAEDARDAALAQVNFAGKWEDLTGALNTPATVYHNGVYWNLLVNLADVTISEPTVDNSDWLFIYSNSDLHRQLMEEASLDLDFVNNKYKIWKGIDEGVVEDTFANTLTFTRASTATGLGIGKIESVGNDVKRLVYSPDTKKRVGLLMEEARVNLLTYSQEFDQSDWSAANITLTPNDVIAPDNTITAYRVTEDAVLPPKEIQRFSVSVSDNTYYTMSIHVKPDQRKVVRLNATFSGILGDLSATVNTSTLEIIDIGAQATAKLERLPNGFVKVSVSALSTGAGTTNLFMTLKNDSGNDYTGDGFSGLYVWGAQLEEAASASSYIPTTTTQVTRAVESCSKPLGEEFNENEGTVLIEYTRTHTAADTPRLLVLHLDSNNSVQLIKNNNVLTAYDYLDVKSSGNSEFLTFSTPQEGNVRLAVSWDRTGNYKLCRNGDFKSFSSVPMADIGVQTLMIGNLSSASQSNEPIEKSSIIPRALSEAELIALTTVENTNP